MKKQKFTPGLCAVYFFLSAWAITTIYPFIWVILNSFRVKNEIRTDSFSIPMGDSFSLENFEAAFSTMDVGKAYLNSIIISISVTMAVIVLAGFASFAIVRYHFPGKKFLLGAIIASMMIPGFATIVPVFRMEAAWGLAGTRDIWKSMIATILPQIAGNLSFATMVLMGFMRSLPIGTEESAFLDGCNVYQIYFKIVMPMARPSFATVSIFAFLWSYNDLFTQSFFLRIPGSETVTLLLNQISSQAGTNYGKMAASVVIVVIPVVIVYIFLQKNIIKGMTAGAIKG
ncbi:MAG: carbohydrate ABC transporter permease [Eubacteriales bacterium]